MPLTKKVYIIFLVSLVRNVSCKSYELRDTDEGCTLATPKIEFSVDGNYTLVLTYNISKQIKYGEMVQVGYLKTFRVFQYIGCISMYKLRNIDKHDVYADPGQCYLLCKSQYFAIYSTHCYCLKKKISARSNRCTLACFYPRSTVCGGEYQHHSPYMYKYASVYKYAPSDKRGIDNERNCRVYITLTDTYEWSNCDYSLPGACMSDVTVTSRQTWVKYTKHCFSRDRNPESTNLKKSLNESIVWIGQIKSWAVIKIIESDTEDKTLGYKGFIDISMNETILDFQKEIKPTKYLCEKVSGQTNIGATEATLQFFNISTSSTTTTTTNTATTTTEQRQTDQDGLKTNQEGQKLDHSLLAIYIIAPFCLIASVVSVVWIIKLRKRNIEIMEFKGHTKSGARKDTIVMQNFEEERKTESERGINLTNISEEQTGNYNYIHPTTADDVVEDQATPDREYDDTVSPAYIGLARRIDDQNMYMTLHEDEQNYMLCS